MRKVFWILFLTTLLPTAVVAQTTEQPRAFAGVLGGTTFGDENGPIFGAQGGVRTYRGLFRSTRTPYTPPSSSGSDRVGNPLG